MKICIINSLYPPYARGGAEVIAKKTADGLSRAGHEVIVVTLGRRPGKETDGNIRVYRVCPKNIFSFLDIGNKHFLLRMIWHLWDAFNISGSKRVKQILLREKPEMVITHNLKGLSYLIPGVIRSLKIQHVHVVHDVQLSRPSGLLHFGRERPFPVLSTLYEMGCKNLFLSPQVVISPSKWLLDYYSMRGFFRKSVKKVLRNPATIARVSGDDDMVKRHDGVLELLYVGQLERSKGILFLIEALKRFDAGKWKLSIVGTGAMESRVRKAVGDDDRFEIAGYVKNEHLAAYYTHSDFTVIPSLCYENSPTVMYESLLSGVPVIAADIGGIGELIEDNVNGYTFAPGDEESLLEVLGFYVRHPDEIERLRNNTVSSVDQYTVDNYVKRLLEVARKSEPKQ